MCKMLPNIFLVLLSRTLPAVSLNTKNSLAVVAAATAQLSTGGVIAKGNPYELKVGARLISLSACLLAGISATVHGKHLPHVLHIKPT